MPRILLTGLSGVGKSTVIDALAARGYQAVDADNHEFSEWVTVSSDDQSPGTPVEPDRDWVWREERMHALLANTTDEWLFVSGCAPNMGQFLPHFDQVILLSAPAAIMVERLAMRTNNSYGKDPAEVARMLDLRDSVEPLLRRIATHEIDTSVPLDEVVAAVLRLAHG